MPSPLPADPAFAQAFHLPGFTAPDDLPLHGLTILAVEDSRFASEALRLMCRRAGARLRRADTLTAARAHLRVYRPDVVIIDLGLPDGRGEALIRELVLARPRPAVVLGSSGAASGRALALAAGADGYLDKPLESLATFCATLLPQQPAPGAIATADRIEPDLLALQDDLNHAARLLADAHDANARGYVASFVYGIARHSHDAALTSAAAHAMLPGQGSALTDLRRLVETRIANAGSGFAASPSKLS